MVFRLQIYSKVTTNPKDYEAMEAYRVFTEEGCDGVVSVGGGSSHDCGKAVRAVAANDGIDICEMAAYIKPHWTETMKRFKPATVPQISVNTTAGTGAETGHLHEQFGLKREDFDHIIFHHYERDFSVEGNPRPFVYEDCIKLLEELL